MQSHQNNQRHAADAYIAELADIYQKAAQEGKEDTSGCLLRSSSSTPYSLKLGQNVRMLELYQLIGQSTTSNPENIGLLINALVKLEHISNPHWVPQQSEIKILCLYPEKAQQIAPLLPWLSGNQLNSDKILHKIAQFSHIASLTYYTQYFSIEKEKNQPLRFPDEDQEIVEFILDYASCMINSTKEETIIFSAEEKSSDRINLHLKSEQVKQVLNLSRDMFSVSKRGASGLSLWPGEVEFLQSINIYTYLVHENLTNLEFLSDSKFTLDETQSLQLVYILVKAMNLPMDISAEAAELAERGKDLSKIILGPERTTVLLELLLYHREIFRIEIFYALFRFPPQEALSAFMLIKIMNREASHTFTRKDIDLLYKNGFEKDYKVHFSSEPPCTLSLGECYLYLDHPNDSSSADYQHSSSVQQTLMHAYKNPKTGVVITSSLAGKLTMYEETIKDSVRMKKDLTPQENLALMQATGLVIANPLGHETPLLETWRWLDKRSISTQENKTKAAQYAYSLQPLLRISILRISIAPYIHNFNLSQTCFNQMLSFICRKTKKQRELVLSACAGLEPLDVQVHSNLVLQYLAPSLTLHNHMASLFNSSSKKRAASSTSEELNLKENVATHKKVKQ